MWPPVLLNKLAKYVFQTGNILHTGDHIPWNKALDGKSDSKIHHMLITDDPQMLSLSTKFGTVEFRQVVGVMEEEMRTAQRWKGAAVLDLLASLNEVGKYFITDMGRQRSVFDVTPGLEVEVREGIERDGSSLGHVTAVCTWLTPGTDVLAPSHSQKAKRKEGYKGTDDESLQSLEAVVIKLDKEAAELLPLVVKARLRKGRFFVYHSASNHTVHLVPHTRRDETIIVTQECPLVADGSYLQIFCSHDFIERMAAEFESLQDLSEAAEFPVEFRFSDPSVLIQVYQRGNLS